MNTISDETLLAYLDGGLGREQAAAVAAQLARDAALAARLEALESSAQSLRTAFSPVQSALTPGIESAIDRLAEAHGRRFGAAAQPTNVVSFEAPARPRRTAQSPMRWAMAASVLLVVGAGLLVSQLPRESGVVADLVPTAGMRLDAAHPVATTLDSTASGELRTLGESGIESVYPVLSFRDAGGSLCREFEIADATQVAVGVACHRDAAWTVEAIAPASGRSSGDEGYRLASGPVPQTVSDAIDRLIDGEPLDAAAERSALEALR